MKRNGKGIIATDMNPSRDVPQPKPIRVYKDGPANGRIAPTVDRSRVLAAKADAACGV
jgi:hypothetical protein